MVVRMLKLPEAVRTAYDVSSLRLVIHAAAPCPIDVKEQMIDWLGPKIVEFYAGSEGTGFFMIGSADWMSHKGSVGRAVLGRSEEHTSELQSLMRISYAVFCLKK